jgi:hypothetical protein
VTLLKQSIKALSFTLLTGQDASDFEVDELPCELLDDEAQAKKQQPAKKQKIVNKRQIEATMHCHADCCNKTW